MANEVPSEEGNDVAKTVKKRRGKSSFTHRKLGTRGGRPKKSSDNECSIKDTVEGGTSELTDQPSTSYSDASNLDHSTNTSVMCSDTSNKDPICSPTSTINTFSDSVDTSINPNVALTEATIENLTLFSSTPKATGGDAPRQETPILQMAEESPVCQNQGDASDGPQSETTAAAANPCCSQAEVDEDNEADFHSKMEVIADVVAELQRRIFLPWVIVSDQDGIYVLLLSRDRAKTTQRSVFFGFGGKEEVMVHCKEVPQNIAEDILRKGDQASNIVLSAATKGDFIDRLVAVVKRFRVYEVCVGVDDAQFMPLWEIDKSGKLDENPYHEARYAVTFRPFACEILVPTQKYFKRRCPACIKNKIRFRSKLPRHTEKEAPPKTSNIHLDREQLVSKVERQQKELKYARAQIAKLKAKLEEAITNNGVDIGDDLSNDLCSIVESAQLTPVQELFFKEQMKQSKKSTGRRWHPALIRFALLIKSTSTAAYRAIQNSGAITLPSERTLYEYSHVIPPEPGITREKVDRISKQLVYKYPLTYQKFHVLLMDEMHINQKLVFLKSTGQLVGYVNIDEADEELKRLEAELKGEEVSETPPVATKVLAYMVKGVANGVEELVGSFPTTDTMDSGELYDKTWEVIGGLERAGVKIIAIVSDGAAMNRAFYALHTPLTKSSEVVFDTVNLCAPSRPIYFFADVPHLLKTIRNCFHKSGTGPKCTRLLTKNKQVIVWKTIRDLFESDKDQTLRRNSKLNSCNVYLNSYSVMKVSYAAQVLSMTVALDLEARNLPGTSETVKFIKKVNNFFDQLNGASVKHGERKANLNLNPYVDVNDKRFDELLEFVNYLKEWRDEVEKKEGFSKTEKAKMMLSQQTLDGITMTVHAFIGATRFLLTEGVMFLNARVFCQDPLERYFSKQRQCGGGSRNPTAAQFHSNEVKIGIHKDVSVRGGNVTSRVRRLDISDEPLAKRKRTKP